jgi:bisphosphoglycerate-independent phosphoglycerate mutase (AlkP superfamily)
VRSGRHDPLGSFWLGNGHHEVVAEPIAITDIAPTILEHFGLEKPAYMHGVSVWPRIVRKMSATA